MNVLKANFSIIYNGMTLIPDKMENFDFQDLISNYFSKNLS